MEDRMFTFHRHTRLAGSTPRAAGITFVAAVLSTLALSLAIVAPPDARADHGSTQQCVFIPYKSCYDDGGAPVERSRSDDVGHGKHLETAATLFRDGNLMVDSHAINRNWFGGLRPRTLVVAVDNAGRSIWVSQVFASQTLCSVPDLSCASERRETFSEGFPQAVGHHTADLRIYHADAANYVNLRNAFIDAIKSAGDIAQAVKDELEKLQKS
jgi:hypothetical protein